MILGILTLITALSISAVAIYYSVAGLMAIFAAAALPIMVMGGTLEVAKLVTAVWLHRYWDRAVWWLKTYLAIAVVVLMFITSMGIFGFLSKAHIEQTSASEESVARVETIVSEIARQTSIVERAESRINQLETSGTGSDANVQAQIDREQQRIDTAYARIQPAIDEQNTIIGSQAKLFQDELDRIDTAMRTVAGYIDSGDKENYKKAQAIIGVKPDGAFGSGSTRAYTAWKDAKNAERQVLLTNIQQATNNPQARAAAAEIKRLRTTVETQIVDSNTLINRLRSNISKTDNTAQIQTDIDEQQGRIKLANTELDTLTEEKIKLEAEYRKLEAEVGPIKYIAEFIYGENANSNMLEEAVRWVIIIIIFVFDPLAVLLLIAAQYTFEFRKKELEDEHGERLRLARAEYERVRAQAIVDNPGYQPDDGPLTGKQIEEIQQSAWTVRQESVNDNGRKETTEEATRNMALRAGPERGNASSGMAMAEKGDVNDNDTINETVNTTEHEPMGETIPEQTISTDDEGHSSMEQTEVQHDGPQPPKVVGNIPNTKNRMFYPEEITSKKNLTLKSLDVSAPLTEEELVRQEELDLKELEPTFQTQKNKWKEENPDQTLKLYKTLYIKGKIDKLPWEEDDSVGYTQNSEQNESTLFNKLKRDNSE